MKARYILPILLLLILLLSYYSFRYIYLPLRDGSDSQFELNQFLIFNFSLKVLVLILKVSIILLVLLMGAFFLRLEYDVKPTFRAIIIAEFILLIPDIIEIATFSQNVYSLDQYLNFTEYSLYDIFTFESVNQRFTYLLKTVNLFQVLYAITLVISLTNQNKGIEIKDSLKLVLRFYLPAWLIWILIVEAFNQSMI